MKPALIHLEIFKVSSANTNNRNENKELLPKIDIIDRWIMDELPVIIRYIDWIRKEESDCLNSVYYNAKMVWRDGPRSC